MVYKAVPTQDVNKPVNLPLLYGMWDVPFFLDSYVTLFNFFTQSEISNPNSNKSH